MESRIELFFSCSQDQEDRNLRDKLEKQLGLLTQEGLISIWHRDKMQAGEEQEREVHMRLNSARIILLLVSPDFITSNYCYDTEMMRAMERHETREARVIPILLRPVEWITAPFAKLRTLPANNLPITSWQDIDEALLAVAKGIREVVEELQKLQQVQDISGTPVDSARLYNSLVRLDYREQAKVFQQFKDKKFHIGAFLIHGAPSYGQGWLLDRLVRQLPNSLAALDFKFSFERKVSGRSLKDLWKELAKWVGLKMPIPINLLPENEIERVQHEIVKSVLRLWQTHTVILILSKLHEIDEQYMAQFVQEFWMPLTEMARKMPAQSSTHYLLMFLVDSANCLDKWSIPVTQQLDQAWEPHVPIKLEKLAQFSYDMLDGWLEYEYETLGSTLTTPDILHNSQDGVPELVLDHVCDLLGYDWPQLIKYRV